MSDDNNEPDYEILPDDTPRHDLSFKIIVIGDSGVGKSCLTMKATKNAAAMLITQYQAGSTFIILSHACFTIAGNLPASRIITRIMLISKMNTIVALIFCI